MRLEEEFFLTLFAAQILSVVVGNPRVSAPQDVGAGERLTPLRRLRFDPLDGGGASGVMVTLARSC